MKFFIDVTENNRCKMIQDKDSLVDDYTEAKSFNTRADAEDFIKELPEYWKENATVEIHENWYIFWADGVNSGFVDYREDFVTDDIEERAMWFETESEAEDYIKSIKERFPECCNLKAVEYIDQD